MTVRMAGGTRKKAGAKPRAAARPRRPALGNDPFERGAAPRETAPISTPPAIPTPTTTTTATPSPTPTATATGVAHTVAAAAARLDGFERRLDWALNGLEGRLEDLAARAGLAGVEGELREALARLAPALRHRLGTLRELVRLIEPPERLDRYGMDARFADRLLPVVDFFYTTWWRVQVRGIEAVPPVGPVVVAANHAGLVPWDAFVLRHAFRRDHPAHRDLRPLLDDRECALPVVGAAAVRSGAVRASAEAAERLLASGGAVGVFPEGSAGARKPWRDRYTLGRFGRGGFVKVALRARSPIVPCAIIGSEEASPGISRTGWLAERIGIPLLSASPALRLAPAALLPLPSRWTLRFGPAVDVTEHPPAAADDPAVVNALTERVRACVQAMLDEDVAARSSVFL
jgi:1-acyl-sn-glycerol-3-phosphate acyltransferase